MDLISKRTIENHEWDRQRGFGGIGMHAPPCSASIPAVEKCVAQKAFTRRKGFPFEGGGGTKKNILSRRERSVPLGDENVMVSRVRVQRFRLAFSNQAILHIL